METAWSASSRRIPLAFSGAPRVLLLVSTRRSSTTRSSLIFFLLQLPLPQALHLLLLLLHLPLLVLPLLPLLPLLRPWISPVLHPR